MSSAGRRHVDLTDLAEFQQAVRVVLTHDIITAVWPRHDALHKVLPWIDHMGPLLRDLAGYKLLANAHYVKVVRQFDTLDTTQQDIFSAPTSGKPFNQRRMAYLCLVLSTFQRSRTEIDLVDIVKAFTPLANQIGRLGFEPTIAEHKNSLVDVMNWLISRGAISVSEGSVESWANNTGDADALFDIGHDVVAAIFRPHRPLQYLDTVKDLMASPSAPSAHDGTRRAAARLLLEQPVVYYAQVDQHTAEILQSRELASELELLTGLVAEYSHEGAMLTDPSGRFTDRRFPNRAGVINRTAGLLASLLLEDINQRSPAEVSYLPITDLHEHNQAITARADRALATVTGAEPAEPTEATSPSPTLLAPFISSAELTIAMADLYDHFGAASFTKPWQSNPEGLLHASISRLTELGMAEPVPGGMLLLPLAGRYRKIIAVARLARDEQLALPFAELGETTS